MIASIIFNNLRDISFQTRILEICNWDENISEKCIEKISDVFHELSTSKLEKSYSKDYMLKKLILHGIEKEISHAVCEYIEIWIKTQRFKQETEYEA